MEPKHDRRPSPPPALPASPSLHSLEDSRRGTGEPPDGFDPPDFNLLSATEALARFEVLAECIRRSATDKTDEWNGVWRTNSEFELTAIIRAAEPQARANGVKDPLRISEETRDRCATQAATTILMTSRDLTDGDRVVDLVGAHKLILGRDSEHLQEVVFLMTLWPRMRGIEGLPPPVSVKNMGEAQELLGLLEEGFRGNLELFHGATIAHSLADLGYAMS